MERQTSTRALRSKNRPGGTDNAADMADAARSDAEKEVLLVELRLQNQELRAARDQAEQALRRFTDLYDSAPIGYLTLRRDGSIRDVNLAGARLLGAPRSDLCNTALSGFVAHDERLRLARFAAKVFESDARRHCETTLLPLGGKPPVIAYLEAMRDELGQECRIAIIDITERKQAESERLRAEAGLNSARIEAERANAAKSRFLAAASHDLRQPLSALSLYVGALEDQLPAPNHELIGNMRQCVAGLSELLSDLLDLSKLEAGVIVPKVCDFSLDAVLTKVISSMEPRARRKHLGLRYRYSSAFGRTDPVLYRRIVTNLVSNAIRYTERGGVLIGCRRKRGKTWVEIWDTGIGIPADKTSEIFEEFKQLGDLGGNREQGTGIGLSIVAKEAALLGLEIRVQSRIGKGSMFAVELPDGAPVEPAVPRIENQRPLRIAVVEDNPDVARALSFSLAALGHVAFISSSAAGTLELLGRTAPDVVLTDYRLPGSETGYDVIAAMRAAFGESLPAMIVTGDTDPGLMRQMARKGITVQHKPLNIESLCSALTELTDRRATTR